VPRLGIGIVGIAALAMVAAGGAGAAGKIPFVLQDRIERPEPFRETPLKLNPPTFRWPETPKAAAWQIQLSRSAEFRNPTIMEAREAFHRPLKPLDPGRYFWRYRARLSTGYGNWSQPESFDISADLPRWALPEWKELLARVPKSHPRIFLRPEEVPAYRRKALAMRPEIERWARESESVMGKEFSLARFQRKEIPAEWNEAQKQVVLRKAAKAAGKNLMDPVTDLCWLWLASDDPRALAEAKRRVMLATQQDSKGFLSAQTSDFSNASLVSHAAVAYDLLYDQFSATERTAIRRMLLERTATIIDEIRHASQKLMTAHGWQHVFLNGLQGALALYGEEPHAAEWLEVGLKSFVALYPWFGGMDGGSQEGANYYANTDLTSSLLTRDLFLSAFGLDFTKSHPWFRANPYFLMYAYPVGGYISQFGDQRRGATPPGSIEKLAALRMADLYQNGYAADYAARIAEQIPVDAQYFRWAHTGDNTPVKRISLDTLPAAHFFRDVGGVFMHSALTKAEDNVRFEFRSSPYGGIGHSHADQNSFHIVAYNEPLIIDSGYYTPAGDAHHAGWTVKTKAHNAILVDGYGQPDNTHGHGEIKRFEQNQDWVYTVGSAATAYEDVDLESFDRHVVWLKGKTTQTYVVIDELAARDGKPHRFDWLLHARQQMQIDEGARRITIRGTKGEAIVSLIEPQAFEFDQHDRFDVPAIDWRNGNGKFKDQWHLRATPPASSHLSIVAVIQVGRPGSQYPAVRPLDAGASVDGWEVQLKDGKAVIRRPGAGSASHVARTVYSRTCGRNRVSEPPSRTAPFFGS
jgi:hypothetical protein